MAAFQRLFRASAPVAVLGSVGYATAGFALADGVHPGRTETGEKLPIYSSTTEAPITLIATPNPLTPYIANAREATMSALGSARSVVEDGVSSWIGFERRVEREVKSVIPKDEALTPGLIYVLVAGLTGSVLTRTRAFPIRFLAPPVFTLAALPYFLPQTAHNLRTYVSDLEDKYVPEFAAAHDRFNSNLVTHLNIATEKIRGASDEARVWSSQAVHTVEEATGLRVAEAVRLGQERVHVAKEKVAEATHAAAAKVEAAETAAATKVDAAVAKVDAAIPPPVVLEVQPVAIVVAPVDAVAAKPTIVPVEESVAAEVVVPAPVAAAVVPAPAAAAPLKEDKPEKPRDLVAKPIADNGKRLV